jgi:hypothetical protein
MTQLTRYTPAQEAPDMDLATLGSVLVKSKYFSDTTEAAQAIVKVLAGREMGIGPIASMTGIYIVKNRVTMGANLIAAQIKRHPIYDYQVVSLTDKGCELAFYEKRGAQRVEIGRSAFSQADAQAAGLTGSDTYKKFPRNMYFSRALTNGARWYTPDVFGGAPVYTPDELGGVADQEAQYIPPTVQANVTTGEVANPTPLTKREKLLARIAEVEAEAESAGVARNPVKPLDQMNDGELLDYGVDLRRSIDIELSLRQTPQAVPA